MIGLNIVFATKGLGYIELTTDKEIYLEAVREGGIEDIEPATTAAEAAEAVAILREVIADLRARYPEAAEDAAVCDQTEYRYA